MFVTKPHYETIVKISEGLNEDKYKNHISYYMTITSDNNEILKYFEPNFASNEQLVTTFTFIPSSL